MLNFKNCLAGVAFSLLAMCQMEQVAGTNQGVIQQINQIQEPCLQHVKPCRDAKYYKPFKVLDPQYFPEGSHSRVGVKRKNWETVEFLQQHPTGNINNYTAILGPKRIAEVINYVGGILKTGHRTNYAFLNVPTVDALYYWPGRAGVTIVNFANAQTPGGNFYGGSDAQEECFCRLTDLGEYLWNASRYYDYNASHYLWVSDLVMFHKDVGVLRRYDGTWLSRDEQFNVDVVTIDAPDLRNFKVNQSDLIKAIEIKLKAALALSLAAGNRKIVLGAFGCGAFKNDPKLVAEITHNILVKQGWEGYFTDIFFAIMSGSSGSDKNLTTFIDTFGDRTNGARINTKSLYYTGNGWATRPALPPKVGETKGAETKQSAHTGYGTGETYITGWKEKQRMLAVTPTTPQTTGNKKTTNISSLLGVKLK